MTTDIPTHEIVWTHERDHIEATAVWVCVRSCRYQIERDAARAQIAEALAVPYDPTMAHEIQMRAILDSGAS